MELPDPTQLVQRHPRKRGYLRLILFIVLVLALTASAILGLVVYSRGKPRGVSPAPTPVMPTPTIPDKPGGRP
jgi:energy-converting hydrogenase Eha subunit A